MAPFPRRDPTLEKASGPNKRRVLLARRDLRPGARFRILRFLVRFKANVNFVGRTSVEVGVRVEAEDLATGSVTHTNSSYLVFVALNDGGRPIPVPELQLETEQQKIWFAEAQERRRQRLAAREQSAR